MQEKKDQTHTSRHTLLFCSGSIILVIFSWICQQQHITIPICGLRRSRGQENSNGSIMYLLRQIVRVWS